VVRLSADLSYKDTKIPSNGINVSAHLVNSVVDKFLAFSDEEVTYIIMKKTYRYATSSIQSCNLRPKSRMPNWRDVTRDKLYDVFDL
jgi:hypothetical protein